MADENVTSDPSQPISGDDANTEDPKEQEKTEIAKEMDALKQDRDKTQGELDKLKQLLYSGEFAQPQPPQKPEENWDFVPQAEVVKKLRNEFDQKLTQMYLGTAQRQQETNVVQQIKDCQNKYTDYNTLRSQMKKVAERIGGNLSAEDCYKLTKAELGQPLQLKKLTPTPKPTEKPTGSSSGTVQKSQFSEKEALQEAARRVGLDEALSKLQK